MMQRWRLCSRTTAADPDKRLQEAQDKLRTCDGTAVPIQPSFAEAGQTQVQARDLQASKPMAAAEHLQSPATLSDRFSMELSTSQPQVT
jgi:hypothetical protein